MNVFSSHSSTAWRTKHELNAGNWRRVRLMYRPCIDCPEIFSSAHDLWTAIRAMKGRINGEQSGQAGSCSDHWRCQVETRRSAYTCRRGPVLVDCLRCIGYPALQFEVGVRCTTRPKIGRLTECPNNKHDWSWVVQPIATWTLKVRQQCFSYFKLRRTPPVCRVE